MEQVRRRLVNKPNEEYKDLRSEIKTFLELVPDEWESLSLRKCVTGGTCLSEAFTKQAQGVSKKIQILKKKFDNKELFESLEPCKTAVEDVSRVVKKSEEYFKPG